MHSNFLFFFLLASLSLLPSLQADNSDHHPSGTLPVESTSRVQSPSQFGQNVSPKSEAKSVPASSQLNRERQATTSYPYSQARTDQRAITRDYTQEPSDEEDLDDDEDDDDYTHDEIDDDDDNDNDDLMDGDDEENESEDDGEDADNDES